MFRVMVSDSRSAQKHTSLYLVRDDNLWPAVIVVFGHFFIKGYTPALPKLGHCFNSLTQRWHNHFYLKFQMKEI